MLILYNTVNGLFLFLFLYVDFYFFPETNVQLVDDLICIMLFIISVENAKFQSMQNAEGTKTKAKAKAKTKKQKQNNSKAETKNKKNKSKILGARCKDGFTL